jgi:predicted nuclease of predicted toxin-antitoxin system
MLFLVDECFPKSVVRGLQQRGHDVTWATLVCRSAVDELVLARATAEGRVVITEDRDFGTLVVRDALPTIGVVIIHASDFAGGIKDAAEAICVQIDRLADKLVGSLTTISPGRVRQRLLEPRP